MIIDINSATSFYHIPDCPDPDVKALATRCISAQRAAVNVDREPLPSFAVAKAAVSPTALERLLSSGGDVHGIAEDESIADVVVFNARHIRNSVHDETVSKLRARLDREVTKMLRRLMNYSWNLRAERSGHFWYPPGSHMSWHTNNKAPGWRAYLTYAEKPGFSFFRYRNPQSGEIVTTMDGTWDLRVFRIDPKQPMWHAVYSETDRFSFGYAIVAKSFVRAALGKARTTLNRGLRTLSSLERAS